jgi:hypothetical protein
MKAFLGVLMVLLMCACSMGHVYEREQFWTATTAARLPLGTPLTEAKALFAANGLELKCCVSGDGMNEAYYALERNVGRALITEYDVAVIIEVSKDEKVARVRVQRWGIGL